MKRAALALALAALAAARVSAQDAGEELFEKKVRPVLVEKCARCHAIEKPKGGLRVDSRDALLRGGASGPALVPGEPAKSLLLRAVRWEDEDLQMPPKERLAAESVAAIEEWIRRGAPMPRGSVVAPVASHWAFQPVRAPAPTRVNDAPWVRDPLDAFVLAKLEAKGLRPSPEADRRTLIRRASYDLTGLPPTLEESDAFERDASPDAFAKVVDRLLASPRFGERWGRHWLDVARYADTKGYVFIEERRYPYAYVYRDWVVRAFNEDLPYDRFLVQQIAADLLPLGADRRPLAALGFLTLGRRFLNNVPDIIDDRIDVVCRGTMALTVSCARCHDHKFDPISTKDYYSLYGVFASAHEPKEPPLLDARPPATAEYEAYRQEKAVREEAVGAFRQARRRELVAELGSAASIARYLEAARDPRDARTAAADRQPALSEHMIERWRRWLGATRRDPALAAYHALAKLPDASFATLAAPTIAALGTASPVTFTKPPASFAEVAARWAPYFVRLKPGAVDVPLEEIEQVFDRKDAEAILDLRNKVAALDVEHPGAPPRAPAVEEDAHPFDPRVFVRGNPNNLGDSVARRLPSVLGKDAPPWRTSGRLELARAIASRENPLTARVFVNRVLLHLLGAPLVRTPSDFGTRSEPPTNPELLDHLASRFAQDWSVKKLIRAVVLSATYRQSSAPSGDGERLDPENALLWRANRKRLDFEAVRDSILAVSGALDGTVGGRPVPLEAPRRTLYVFVDRQNLPALFRTFDFATPDATSPRRAETTVPQQALFFLNAPFVVDAARRLGESCASVDDLYARVLGRRPASDERALGDELLAAARPSRTAAWSYGYGEPTESGVRGFTAFPHFSGTSYQGGPSVPDAQLAYCLLHATGGHPGRDSAHAVVRRFTSPQDGVVAISGRLRHPDIHGDGVRARIYSSDQGLVGEWVLKHGVKDVVVEDVPVKRGTTLDFVVDCRKNDGYDSFEWAPRLVFADGDGEWDAERDFRGPGGDLAPRARLAQVLLETNEFAFED